MPTDREVIAFEFSPFFGALPLRFDMDDLAVEAILGPAIRKSMSYFGNPTEERALVNLEYSSDTNCLQEIILLPGASLIFKDCDLYSISDPIQYLSQFDPSPFLIVGMVVFHQLGIRFSGFHDHEESQKAIGVAQRGSWEYVEDFEPYRA